MDPPSTTRKGDSARVLRQALRRIRGDVAEYTNCFDVLVVRRGKRVGFKVVKGGCTLRADGRRACSAKVTAKAKETVRASVVCR